MKKWQYLLGAAVLFTSLASCNIGQALTPGYYARMDGDKLTGQLLVLNHKGVRCFGDKCKKDTLKVLSITNITNEKRPYSLNTTYTNLNKTEAITDKSLIYYGEEYSSFCGKEVDNIARLYEAEEKLILNIEETTPGTLKVTSEAPDEGGYTGTYIKEKTFYQAGKPLVVFTLEQLEVLPPRENRSYVITNDNSMDYNIIANENGESIARFVVRVDLSKIYHDRGPQDGKSVTLFISDYAKKYDAKQAKEAKKAKG